MRYFQLVTFDVFGTLLDWQSYVDQAFPGRYGVFRQAMAEQQEPGRAIFPYRRLLYDVGMDLGTRGPRPAREELSFFAEGLGFAKPFVDARAVQHLAAMTLIGAVSNCDLRHLMDVQKSLGLVFDVSVVAEEARAYKPHAEAWNHFYDHVTRRLGFDRQSWLHVSAFVDTDLMPAKERGIATCFLARPGGSVEPDAAQLSPDYTVADLWELTDLLTTVNGQPVRHVLKATVATPELVAEVARWLQREHGPEVLQARGCQAFQVLQPAPLEIVCEAIFTNRAALADFTAGPLAELEAKLHQRVPAGQIRLDRATAAVCAGSRQRRRGDFQPARPQRPS